MLNPTSKILLMMICVSMMFEVWIGAGLVGTMFWESLLDGVISLYILVDVFPQENESGPEESGVHEVSFSCHRDTRVFWKQSFD